MSGLEALAKRCEEAVGADRMLDALIHQALNPDREALFDPGSVREKRAATFGRLRDFPVGDFAADPDGIAAHIGAPDYTASLDAAMTLGDPRHVEWCNQRVEACCFGDEFDSAVYVGSAATPALAFCAAALRARACLPQPVEAELG